MEGSRIGTIVGTIREGRDEEAKAAGHAEVSR
jgi:hypothetical protein